MRFKHGELEQLRTDFAAWVASKRSEGSGPRMSYRHATRMGIYRLHRGDSVPAVLKYLGRFLDSYHLGNSARRNEAEVNISAYSDWMAHEPAAFIATKTRIQFAITPDILLGGELPRIDLLASDDGYRAVLLGESNDDWQSQLRMPLIQRAVATTLKRPESLVYVGVQDLDGTHLELKTYSKRQINLAVSELRDIAHAAASALSQ